LPASETVIFDVFAAFDHKKVEVEVEVKVTLPPIQKVVGPSTVIVGVAGKSFTVTVVEAKEAL
jgi:hypothetical protein